MKTNICGVCKETRPVSEFHKTKSRPNGLQWACKDCERVLAKRQREKRTDIYKAAAKRYWKRNNEKCRQRLKQYSRTHVVEDKARRKVRVAIRNGVLVRQPCEVCQNPKVHAHHDDYSKPLDVRWLCHKHHLQIHKQKHDVTALELHLQEKGLLRV